LLTRMYLGIAALSLALCLAGSARGYAQSTSTGGTMGSSMGSSSAAQMGHINWSDAYQLTPLEHKRLRAMGLSDPEVFAVAKAARESGREVDDVAQMVMRGRSYFQIAEQLGVPYNSLFKWPARWQTPQWQEEVRAGSPVWIPNPQGMTPGNGGDMENSGGNRRERQNRMRSQRGATPGAQRVSAPSCPVCHMQLVTTASAANPRAVVIEGKTYYCCAGCDMSKLPQ
jgi:hypothetical protein